MAKYREKPVVIEAITFAELIEFGKNNGGNIVNGMPWSFNYKGHPITHENDECYLIPTLDGTLHFTPQDMLITGIDGEIYPCKIKIFAKTYDKVTEGESPINFPEFSNLNIKDGDIIHCEFENCSFDEAENTLTNLKEMLAKSGYPSICILANQKGDVNISILDEDKMRKLGWVRLVSE